MVFDKIIKALNPTSEKYEVLYLKYSKLRLDNKNLRDQHHGKMSDLEHEVKLSTARNLIALFEKIEETKRDTHKINVVDPNIQKVMMGITQTEKCMVKVMDDLELEPIQAVNKFYDESEAEIASYTPANGMAQNLILKTVRKGFKFRGKMIKKPRVVVTR
jgi:molecular chaperone GrpE (heat shock protein)